MIDHVSIQVSDLRRSAAFYAAALEPLGYAQMVASEASVGFGKHYPEVWLNLRRDAPRAAPGAGAHICLRAHTEGAVRQFHDRAVAEGGASDGAPGPRQGAMTTYFAAFILDLDGNRIEAASFPVPPERG
jgi:catechol 2,3-dioxygenase-like lactoylglutathione lyase family enzyme